MTSVCVCVCVCVCVFVGVDPHNQTHTNMHITRGAEDTYTHTIRHTMCAYIPEVCRRVNRDLSI